MGGSIEPPFLMPKENYTVGQRGSRQLDNTAYTKHQTPAVPETTMPNISTGVGMFTAENIASVIRAIPESNGTYRDVARKSEQYGGCFHHNTMSNWVKHGQADVAAKCSYHQATLRRSATMAGSSGPRSSLLHNFHQGRGGGSSVGWKFQTASARKSRCSKNWLRSALACWAIFVSRSYGSLSKNTTRSKNSARVKLGTVRQVRKPIISLVVIANQLLD